MNHYQALAAFLEREAGHFMVSFLLILIGAALWKIGVPRSEDLMLIGTGYLGRSMIGRKGGAQ